MIEVKNLSKKFDNFYALKGMNCTILNGCVYGLVGSNGSGKSTFLRLATGVYRADEGEVTFDGIPVYDNPQTKKRIAYVSDDVFFLPRASLNRMAAMYEDIYKDFSYERYNKLTAMFRLNPNWMLQTFSKGMRRQAATLLALSCMADYMFFDETFDGLDPVMRNLVKNLLYYDVCERKATVVVTSHSLRELEDTCDQLALLHKGGVVFESDISNLKTALFKVQVAFDHDYDRSLFDGLDIKTFSKQGSVSSIIVGGDRDETTAKIKAMSPVLFEILPLSLEEVFVYEMDALGYAFNEVLD